MTEIKTLEPIKPKESLAEQIWRLLRRQMGLLRFVAEKSWQLSRRLEGLGSFVVVMLVLRTVLHSFLFTPEMTGALV